MSEPYEYEVVQNIPEIGARVWDVLVWRYPDIYLCRKRGGEFQAWHYSSAYTFLFLKYEATHLRPLDACSPPLEDLARQVVGGWPSPRQVQAFPRLRLVR